MRVGGRHFLYLAPSKAGLMDGFTIHLSRDGRTEKDDSWMSRPAAQPPSRRPAAVLQQRNAVIRSLTAIDQCTYLQRERSREGGGVVKKAIIRKGLNPLTVGGRGEQSTHTCVCACVWACGCGCGWGMGGWGSRLPLYIRQNTGASSHPSIHPSWHAREREHIEKGYGTHTYTHKPPRATHITLSHKTIIQTDRQTDGQPERESVRERERERR